MKPVSLAAALFAGASMLAIPSAFAQEDTAAPAGLYVEDNGHAYINFTYDHLGFSAPYLRYNEFDVEVDYDPDNIESSTVKVVIQADSIDSGVEDFDEHLNSADFFETETYPEITFVSTELTKTSETEGKLTGDLTIKDVTKPVTLDVTLNKIGETRDGSKAKMGLSARGTILRSAFGVDLYAPAVSDEVDLIIELELEQADT